MTEPELNTRLQTITPPDEAARAAAHAHWAALAKPLGGLGSLETILEDAAALTGTPELDFARRAVLVLCADNGVVAQGVSQTDASVTRAVLQNLAARRTSVCQMAAAAHCSVVPVDMGIAGAPVPGVQDCRIAPGTKNFTCGPAMTRAQAVQILYNLEGQPEVTGEATFSDMNTAPDWSMDAIAWAQDTGVVAGMGDNTFAPNLKVTREQFAQMLYNYAKYKKCDLTKAGDLTKFPDEGSISTWAETALSWANGNGLINGHENGTLDPQGNTVRGQAASILMNFDLNVVKSVA